MYVCKGMGVRLLLDAFFVLFNKNELAPLSIECLCGLQGNNLVIIFRVQVITITKLVDVNSSWKLVCAIMPSIDQIVLEFMLHFKWWYLVVEISRNIHAATVRTALTLIVVSPALPLTAIIWPQSNPMRSCNTRSTGTVAPCFTSNSWEPHADS